MAAWQQLTAGGRARRAGDAGRLSLSSRSVPSEAGRALEQVGFATRGESRMRTTGSRSAFVCGSRVARGGGGREASQLCAGRSTSKPVRAASVRYDLATGEAGAVTERLACSPPTKANRVQSLPGRSRIFASGDRTGRCRWFFSGISRFPRSFTPALLHAHLGQTTHLCLGETGSIPSGVTSGFSRYCWSVGFSGISRSLCPYIPALLHTHLASPPPPPKALKTTIAEMRGWGKREIPEKTRRPATSSGTIPTCENPGATPPGIEPGSPRWEASSLATTPPRPLLSLFRLGGRCTRHECKVAFLGWTCNSPSHPSAVRLSASHPSTVFARQLKAIHNN
ncbi:hypothetical protein PR048_027970 [Dryococelus australis]|uniref:Uncharacterized protein n=1 Tax=Dryococelus australis TaxID=614101 RepID=A0ABQ9GI12_9NEOP|nr:hypothetical protein PR048_027970 [Dryococelus australis]